MEKAVQGFDKLEPMRQTFQDFRPTSTKTLATFLSGFWTALEKHVQDLDRCDIFFQSFGESVFLSQDLDLLEDLEGLRQVIFFRSVDPLGPL